MLNGKLGISRADNGWSLQWYTGKDMSQHCEVFTDAQACMARVADVVGMVGGAAAARAFLSAAEAHAGPSVDAEVAALMPDNAPPACAACDD